MKKILFLCFFAFTAKAQTQIIAVYGTSIEYGYKSIHPNTDSWPARLQYKLGTGYSVKNYGKVNGTYCYSSYSISITKAQIQEAGIVVLGGPTNDAAYVNQPSANVGFRLLYQRRIDSIRKWNPSAKIYCCMAIKAASFTYLSQQNINLRNSQVRDIAWDNGLTVWSSDQLPISILSPDGLHPTTAGYETMADFYLKEYTNEMEGVPITEIYSEERIIPVYPGLELHINKNKRTLYKK